MKKTVILILAVLPIVLLVIIAFAGQILSIYQNIPVEKVEFVNDEGDAYTSSVLFKVPKGETLNTKIHIYPELASNKRVTYSTSNPDICTVNSDGAVTGISSGMTTIVVKTDDGAKTAMLSVQVTEDIPYDVILSPEELTLATGQKATLTWEVKSYVAVNKAVTFTSSDTSVARVNSLGVVTAVGPGTATITVTTVSGGVTDTSTVTVEDAEMPISFDLSGIAGANCVNPEEGIWLLSRTTVDLNEITKLMDEDNRDKLKFSITYGTASLSDGILTFTAGGMITVKAYIEGSPTITEEITFVYSP